MRARLCLPRFRGQESSVRRIAEWLARSPYWFTTADAEHAARRRHRVQSVLAPRVGCRLGVSVAAHASAATCSYNSLLLSLRSVTSETL